VCRAPQGGPRAGVGRDRTPGPPSRRRSPSPRANRHGGPDRHDAPAAGDRAGRRRRTAPGAWSRAPHGSAP